MYIQLTSGEIHETNYITFNNVTVKFNTEDTDVITVSINDIVCISQWEPNA